MRIGQNDFAVSASADDLSGTGDSITFYPAVPVRVVRWGLICSTAVVHNSMAAELNLSTYDGATTVTETASGGTTLLMAADAVIGEVLYVEPTSEVVCRPGDFLQIEITVAATSGSGYGFIEYQPLPNDPTGVLGSFPDATPANSIQRFTDLST
jgi:hypothetical protein